MAWPDDSGGWPDVSAPSTILFGDSLSPNAFTTLVFDNTATTDTLNINDGAVGSSILTPPTGTFTKTFSKIGAAVTDIYSESRVGYVRLDNTSGQTIKIGSANLNMGQDHCIGVLARMPLANITGYAGVYDLVKTSQNGASGQPQLALGVAGASNALAKQIYYRREGNAGAAAASLVELSDVNIGSYPIALDIFGKNITAIRQDADWVWLFGFGNTDADSVVFNGSASGTSIMTVTSGSGLKDRMLIAGPADTGVVPTSNYYIKNQLTSTEPDGALGGVGTYLMSATGTWTCALASGVMPIEDNYSMTSSSFPRANNNGAAHAVLGDTKSTSGVSQRIFNGFHNGYGDGAVFTASMSGSVVMTVSAMTSGTIGLGNTLSGTGLTANSYIYNQLTGDAGGVGTYLVRSMSGGAVNQTWSTTVSATAITPNLTNVDFVLSSGSSGSGKTVDIARVFKCKKPNMAQLGLIASGMHPKALGLMSGDDFCHDFGSLPAGCTSTGSPTFNPAEDAPIVHRYHGDTTSDVVLSLTNKRVA